MRKATLAKKQYRYSNDCKYRERKKKASHEYQRAFRKKLNKVTEMKEKYNAKKAEYMVWKRAYKKWAVDHNKRYTSEFDKVAPKMSMKDAILSFGKVTRNYLFVFPRMKTLDKTSILKVNLLVKWGMAYSKRLLPHQCRMSPAWLGHCLEVIGAQVLQTAWIMAVVWAIHLHISVSVTLSMDFTLVLNTTRA